MKPPITILRATESNLEQVLQIEKEANLSSWSYEAYSDKINRIDRSDSLFLIAYTDNIVVGFILTRLIDSSAEADILNIGVLKNYRNKKIGQKLLEKTIEECKQRNISTIWLEVRASNTSAITFYRKCGFQQATIRKNFYEKPLEDALIMKLEV